MLTCSIRITENRRCDLAEVPIIARHAGLVWGTISRSSDCYGTPNGIQQSCASLGAKDDGGEGKCVEANKGQ
jgi:hypothetical protein